MSTVSKKRVIATPEQSKAEFFTFFTEDIFRHFDELAKNDTDPLDVENIDTFEIEEYLIDEL